MKTKLNRDLIARLAYATRPVISGGRVSKWEPNATSYIVFDSELAGFGIKVCATHNVYVVQVRVGPRVVKATVGKDGQLTLKEARERARGLITDLKDGVDVNGEKRKARQKKPIPTVKQVLTDYKGFLAEKARGKANPNTLKVLDRAIKNLNGIGSLLLARLTWLTPGSLLDAPPTTEVPPPTAGVGGASPPLRQRQAWACLSLDDATLAHCCRVVARGSPSLLLARGRASQSGQKRMRKPFLASCRTHLAEFEPSG